MVLCEGARDAQLKAFCRERGPLYSHPRHIAVMPAVPSNSAGNRPRRRAGAVAGGMIDLYGATAGQPAAGLSKMRPNTIFPGSGSIFTRERL